jgi:hypothetical protein
MSTQDNDTEMTGPADTPLLGMPKETGMLTPKERSALLGSLPAQKKDDEAPALSLDVLDAILREDGTQNENIS